MSLSRSWFSRGLDQDWVDRANGFWSVLLLSVCSLGAFLARYISKPISCVCPAHFTYPFVQYALDTCFMKDTFYLPLDNPLPIPGDPRQGYFHSYHLWIPMILFIQALCFKIPNIIWSTCKRNLFINLDETVISLQSQQGPTESRKSMFQETARVLDSLLKRNSFFLGILYLVIKLLFILNLLGQFIFITIFFKDQIPIKVESLTNLNVSSLVIPILPKTVLCDYSVRVIDNFQKYTMQCTFSITEVYEKMYVFLWYWIFFVGVATFFNMLLWAGYLFIPFLRDSKISAYINAAPGPAKDSSSITRFISSSLGLDGALLMSMISQNSSEMVAASLSQEMYEVFLQKNRPAPYSQPMASTSGATGLYPGLENVPMRNMAEIEGKPPPV